MEPVSRRSALLLGGAGMLSLTAGASGFWWLRSPTALKTVTGESFLEPKSLKSSAGALDARLVAAASTHRVAGRRATTLGYNKGLPGPTLRINPGDILRIELVNQLQEPTNLHVHGLHVSPTGKGDDVFVSVGAGDSYRYEYQLPDDHPPGVYWYHPHLHGTVADQVFGGLFGAIVVEDTTVPDVTRDRVMVVSDIDLDESGHVRTPSDMQQQMAGREGDLVLVNGQVRPVLSALPGERERWRIVNACTSRYLSLTLDGQDVQLVGRDLGQPSLRADDDLVLAPGNRADLVLTAVEGRSVLRAEPFDRGGMGSMMGGGSSSQTQEIDLVTFEVSGSGPPAPQALDQPSTARDLRDSKVSKQRVLTFAMSGGMMGSTGGMSFTIDGKTFDADRIDQEVAAGAIEEWTIRNDSSLDHPFHLHVWPMQVVTRSGEPERDPTWLDVVNVPARSEVSVRIAFEDYTGRTVYHCHILDHEDRGMMGVVRVA